MKSIILSELVSHVGSTGRTDAISYTWHKRGNGDTGHAFVIALTKQILDRARCRSGDKCEIEITDTQMIISLGEKLPFSITARHKSSRNFQIKISSNGIDALQSIFPHTNKVNELDVIEVGVAKIRLKLPSK